MTDAGGLTATSNVWVNVRATATSIAVSPAGASQVRASEHLDATGDVIRFRAGTARGRRRVVAPSHAARSRVHERSSRASRSEGDPSRSASDEATSSACPSIRARVWRGVGAASVGSGSVGTPPRSGLGPSASRTWARTARISAPFSGSELLRVQGGERPCEPARMRDEQHRVPRSFRRRAEGLGEHALERCLRVAERHADLSARQHHRR